jgi:putative ABC transport system substrate-binding protein
MRRREFLKVVAGLMTCSPFVARAEQPERMRLIGVQVAFAESDPIARPRLAAFRDALTKLGWTENRNLRIELR